MPIYTDKKTKRIYIQFDFQGATYKERLPEDFTKRDAEKREVEWKHQLYFQTSEKPAAENIHFEDFLVEYYLPFAENNHCKDSFYRDVSICKEALKLFRGMNLRVIKPADVEKFKSVREKTPTAHGGTRKPATIARELSVISKVFSVAVKNDFLEYNPCSRIEKPQYDNIQNRILRLEDEERFFASFKSEWARDVCVLVLNTGLRQNDALGLSKLHIDWNLEVIRLIQGKTGRKVIIPMNITVQKLLRARWENGNDLLFPSLKTGRQGTSVIKAMLGAGSRAKIGHLTVRDLRRTFGTRLDELNYSSSVKAKLLGHGDLRSVHRYERGTEILREAVLHLENANPTKILPAAQNEKAPTRVSA